MKRQNKNTSFSLNTANSHVTQINPYSKQNHNSSETLVFWHPCDMVLKHYWRLNKRSHPNTLCKWNQAFHSFTSCPIIEGDIATSALPDASRVSQSSQQCYIPLVSGAHLSSDRQIQHCPLLLILRWCWAVPVVRMSVFMGFSFGLFIVRHAVLVHSGFIHWIEPESTSTSHVTSVRVQTSAVHQCFSPSLIEVHEEHQVVSETR